jgi:hypothetical protein
MALDLREDARMQWDGIAICYSDARAALDEIWGFLVGCRWDIGYSSLRHSDWSAGLEPLPRTLPFTPVSTRVSILCHATIFMIKSTDAMSA